MKAIHPREAFRYWAGRLALAAMLALVLVPTAGRLYAGAATTTTATVAAAGSGSTGTLIAHAAHADHAGAATTPERPAPPPGEQHPGHADCPYCPLLGQLADAAHPLPLLANPPAGPAPAPTVAAGHAGPRLHGPHARGPPAAA